MISLRKKTAIEVSKTELFDALLKMGRADSEIDRGVVLRPDEVTLVQGFLDYLIKPYFQTVSASLMP